MKYNTITKYLGVIPKVYEFEEVIFQNYDKFIELHKKHGWIDYVEPIFNSETQKLGEIIVVDNIATREIIDLTPEEIENSEFGKLAEYRKKIYDLTESLITSSKARALGKVGQGLNYKQLQDLEIIYTNKKNVAQGYLNNDNSVNPIILDLISFEVENDFKGEKLDNEVAYFNANYNANIDTSQSRLNQYCNLILVKYNLGVQLDNTLQALCESFRSKMITNLDNKEFNKIDQREALILTITNDTSITEILTTIKTQFDAI